MAGTLRGQLQEVEPRGRARGTQSVVTPYLWGQTDRNQTIVGMAAVSMTDGLVKLLKKESITKGIDVVIDEENAITIDFHVIVSYGVNISSVSDNLIENVRYKVEEFTGLKVSKINIFVEGVRIID